MTVDNKLWDIAYEQYAGSDAFSIMTFGEFYGRWAPTKDEWASATNDPADIAMQELIDAEITRNLEAMRSTKGV